MLLDALRRVNRCSNLDEAIDIIVKETCEILHCDRATLFMVDPVHEKLVIKTAVGAEDIRIPWDAGIVGEVYQKGETLNIPNAYEDDRFHADTDKKTGYKTHSILCCPIKDTQDVEVAVLQAINKKQKAHDAKPTDEHPWISFTTEDIMLIEHLSSQLGVILRNCQLFERTLVAKQKVSAMLDICKSLQGDMGMNSLMFTITEQTPKLMDCDRCTVYMVDRAKHELWSMHGAVEIRVPIGKGLAGSVGDTGKVINIAEAYEDDRFDQSFDKKTGYRTKTILCTPILDDTGHTIGVIQLINKNSGEVFDDYDEEILGSFLEIAGRVLQHAQIFTRTQRRLTEFEKLGAHKQEKKKTEEHHIMGGAIIEEGDEEEEEEDDEDVAC